MNDTNTTPNAAITPEEMGAAVEAIYKLYQEARARWPNTWSMEKLARMACEELSEQGI